MYIFASLQRRNSIIQIIRAVAGAMYSVAGTGISAVQAGVSMTLTGLSIVSGAAETMLLNCMSKPFIWGADFVCNTAWAAQRLYHVWFQRGGKEGGGGRERRRKVKRRVGEHLQEGWEEGCTLLLMRATD